MKNMKKIISAVLSLTMCVSAMAIPAMAADNNPPAIFNLDGNGHAHPENTMNPTKTVYPIGDKSFYKITGDPMSGFNVIYADRNLDGTYSEVPSAFIKGSEYNQGNLDYGMYVTDDGEFHVVALQECHLEDDGSYTFYHGTKDSATVSEEVDKVTNSDQDMSTEFYINIENGSDPDGDIEIDGDPVEVKGDGVDYEITVSTHVNYNLNATVPMYVCMYGYRATGDVLAPTEDAYRLKNYSTINTSDKATIKDITRLTTLTPLYDEKHSDDEIYSIAYDKETNKYTYWYSDPDAVGNTVDGKTYDSYLVIKDKHINASGQSYTICIDRDSDGTLEWEFYAAGVLDNGVLRETVSKVGNDAGDFALKEDFVFDEWNFGKTPAVGDVIEDQDKSTEGMPIKVSEIQATPSTWRLVPSNTGVDTIHRGELVMTIAPEKAQEDASAIDLSKCSTGVDITDRGWYVDAPSVDATSETVLETGATSLGMNVNARMAGGNVNDAGCTSVVKVHYTVSPVFDLMGDDDETQTEAGAGSDTNRDPNEGVNSQ